MHRYDNLFRFPNEYIDDFKKQLIPDFVSADKGPLAPSSYADILNLEPGLVFPTESLNGVSVTLRATLDNGLTVTVPSHELVRPVRGLDKSGKPQVNEK